MEKKLVNVIGLLKNAKRGNKEALALLHLGDDLEYKPPCQATITNKEVVKKDLCTFTYVAAAADRLGLRSMEEVARRGVQYAMYAYHSVSNMRPRLGALLNGLDVAEELLNLIEEICLTFNMLLKVEQIEKERIEEEDEDQQSQEDKEEDGHSEADQEDNEQDMEPEEKKKRKRKKKKKKKTPNDESHHLSRKCIVKGCIGYEGPNLKRHLMNVHARKGHIEHTDIGKYFAMGLKPKRKRGPKRSLGQGKTTKGRCKRWCPEKDCNYLGCNLPHDLQNKHHMSPKSMANKLSLKFAR